MSAPQNVVNLYRKPIRVNKAPTQANKNAYLKAPMNVSIPRTQSPVIPSHNNAIRALMKAPPNVMIPKQGVAPVQPNHALPNRLQMARQQAVEVVNNNAPPSVKGISFNRFPTSGTLRFYNVATGKKLKKPIYTPSSTARNTKGGRRRKTRRSFYHA
jgi:hypothetical protein